MTTPDYPKALAAARKRVQIINSLRPELLDDNEIAIRDLVAAIDAARGQAVAWQVTVVDNTGTHDYAKWAGLQAPPAAAPTRRTPMSDLDKALAAALDAAPCVCGEPTLGVVHRADGPCYLPEQAPPAALDAAALAKRLDKMLGTHADSMPKEAYAEVDAVMRALKQAQPAALAERKGE